MIFQLLRFYLDRNQSHGQNDRFLRAFLLQLKLCRPQEDLKFWQFSYYCQKSAIFLSQEVKNLKIILLDKTDDELTKSQNEFIDEIIRSYRQNLDIRQQLIIIYLTNDLDEGNVLAHSLIENKKMIEFLQWRKAIEIKEWVKSCVEDLEIENWFWIELNNYL